MIEAEAVEHRRVEVVDVDLVGDGGGAEFIGRAVDGAALDAAAGQHDGERLGVVVAAGVVVAVFVFGGLAAELAAPNDEGAVEEAALFEVGEERGERAVDLTGLGGEFLVEVLVMVPAVVPDLDDAHAALDEPAGDKELFALLAGAVGGAGGFGFFGDVERVGGLGLHAEGDLVGFEARLEGGFALEILGVDLVELVDEVELAALLFWGDVTVADVLNHLLHVGGGGVDRGALERAGKEGGAVVGDATDGEPAVAQGDEAGEILILGAEAVNEPRAEAGLHDAERSGVHEDGGDVVGGNVGPHGADDGEVVGMGGGLGKGVADLEAGAAVFLKLEGRAHGDAAVGESLAVAEGEGGLGVPRVEVRGGALGEDMDDGFGLAGEMRRLGEEWARPESKGGGGRCAKELGLRDERGETEGAHAHADAGEKLAAGQKIVLEIGRDTVAGAAEVRGVVGGLGGVG